MTEATYNYYLSCPNSNREVFDITLSADGNTITSRKFNNPRCIGIQMIGAMAATDAYSVSSVSGAVMTIKAIGTTTAHLIVTVGGQV